jgi:hypothetical protein
LKTPNSNKNRNLPLNFHPVDASKQNRLIHSRGSNSRDFIKGSNMNSNVGSPKSNGFHSNAFNRKNTTLA